MNTTLELTPAKSSTKKVKLIDGRFTKNEAIHILNEILDIKINFHKLQRLSKTEGYVNGDHEFDSSRILELISNKEELKNFLKPIISEGYNIKINSTITISVEQ